MSSSLPRFMVIRCQSCNRHHGMLTKGRASCRFCGTSIDSAAVIARTDDASELQRLVAEHNLPDDLSEEFSVMGPTEHPSGDKKRLEPEQAQAALRQALGGGDRLSLTELQSAIHSLDSSYDASRLAAEAEAEGLLVQVSEGQWIWLG